MGRASRRKKANKPTGGDDGSRELTGLARITLFSDVHPDSRINTRLFSPLFQMAVETTLAQADQERVGKGSLLILANKLATTWKHLAKYRAIESRLLEAARKTPLKHVQPTSHDPELYRACDDFMVQLRDGLNRLWLFPAQFFSQWPFNTLPKSLETVRDSISRMTDARQIKLATPIIELLEENWPWMELVRSITTDGLNPLAFCLFVVAPESEPGEPREVVPSLADAQTANELMGVLWDNFLLLSEFVGGASIAAQLRPEVLLRYQAQPPTSNQSSWTMMKPQARLKTQPGDMGAVREALALAQSGQPMLQATFKGKRFRVVGSQLIMRPPEETFHEFLWGLLRTTLGDEWWKAEQERVEPERHQVVRWFDALQHWKNEGAREENKIEGGWRARPSGDVQALTSLAYDVYTLQHAGTLPAKLIARLRDHSEFQGAKYEIAVAAMLRRAGFTLTFLEGSETHCEFLAKHATGIRIGVEAKSRRRPGVLHEKGQLDELKAVRGDVQALFDDAKQQKPDGLPFLIFIDLNAPLGSTVTPIDPPWLKDLDDCFATHEAIAGDRPDPFSAVVVTNFSVHYVGSAQVDSKGEALLIPAKRPADSLPEPILREVWAAVGRYGTPPEDLERFGEKADVQPPVESSGGSSVGGQPSD